MTDSIDTSEREAEEPRGPFNLPIREMRAEPVPHQPADPLRAALQLALEATPEELPTALAALIDELRLRHFIVLHALPLEISRSIASEVPFKFGKALSVSDLQEGADRVQALCVQRPQDSHEEQMIAREARHRNGVANSKCLLKVRTRSAHSLEAAQCGGKPCCAYPVQKGDLEQQSNLPSCLLLEPFVPPRKVQGDDGRCSGAESPNPIGCTPFQESTEPVPAARRDQGDGDEDGDHDTDADSRGPVGRIVFHGGPPAEEV